MKIGIVLYPTFGGSDSVVTLDLTINNLVFTQDIEISCDSVFIWNGNPLYSSGLYLDTLQHVV